ncbi:MAG: UDP-N-acetylmuramoyl-tripeptide--D-alanyl-D-alanine ligase, partial [Desulfobacterales bacterium]
MALTPLPWRVTEIIEATAARHLAGPNTGSFQAVGIDSRTYAAGTLFVAIGGERHDGHNFIDGVIEKGGQGVLMALGYERNLPVASWGKAGACILGVADTTRALGALAAYRRRQSGIPLVAITGSNGKTSTRRMTAAVLATRYETLASRGNFNNEIGLPLTLLGLCPGHQMAVVELGMNHLGEIGRLTQICQPQTGVITTIAPAHLEGVRTLAGVVQAKGELLAHMAPGGKAVLNADDFQLVKLGKQSAHPVVWFGTGDKAQVRASDILSTPSGDRFGLILPEGEVRIQLRMPGRFMISNALAAAAVGWIAGCTPNQIKAGLESVGPSPGRMVHVTTPKGIEIVDDTYNANPGSMSAAFETMAGLSPQKPWVLVCGDMLELGEEAPQWHRRVGREAVDRGAGAVYAHGPHGPQVTQGALDAGLDRRRVLSGTKAELIGALKERLAP